MTKKKKMPSIFTMAKNFAKDLGKYIKEGAPNVTHAQYTKRLETCNTCPHLRKEQNMRCGLCGCLVEQKAKWRTTTCPDKPPRWPAVYSPPGDPVDERARKAKVANKVLHKMKDLGAWDPNKPHTAGPILKAMGYTTPEIDKFDKDGKRKEIPKRRYKKRKSGED